MTAADALDGEPDSAGKSVGGEDGECVLAASGMELAAADQMGPDERLVEADEEGAEPDCGDVQLVGELAFCESALER